MGNISKSSMIGGNVLKAIPADLDKRKIHDTNSAFWDANGNEVLGATSLPLYGAYVSEKKLQLIGDVEGKKVLEIGCGNEHVCVLNDTDRSMIYPYCNTRRLAQRSIIAVPGRTQSS